MRGCASGVGAELTDLVCILQGHFPLSRAQHASALVFCASCSSGTSKSSQQRSS